MQFPFVDLQQKFLPFPLLSEFFMLQGQLLDGVESPGSKMDCPGCPADLSLNPIVTVGQGLNCRRSGMLKLCLGWNTR